MRTPPHHRRTPDDEGVVAIEFVLVAPFLIALLVAIASFGVFFSKHVEVTGAARDAARTLALRGTPVYPDGMTPSAIVTCAPGDTTSDASVTLTATYTFSIPGIPLGTKTMTSTARMRCGG